MTLGLGLLLVGGALYVASRRKQDDAENVDPSSSRPSTQIGDQLVNQCERWRTTVAQKIENKPRVTVPLVLAVIAKESSGNVNAVNRTGGGKGAWGLMQVRTPAMTDYNRAHGTAYEVESLKGNAGRAIEVGSWYLNLWVRESGSVYDGLRSYYAGPGAAKKSKTAGREYARWVLDKALPRFQSVPA